MGQKETAVPQADREWRKIPAERISHRIGVADYQGQVSEQIVELRPEEAVIQLKQGPGRLPEPVVAVGDVVEKLAASSHPFQTEPWVRIFMPASKEP